MLWLFLSSSDAAIAQSLQAVTDTVKSNGGNNLWVAGLVVLVLGGLYYFFVYRKRHPSAPNPLPAVESGAKGVFAKVESMFGKSSAPAVDAHQQAIAAVNAMPISDEHKAALAEQIKNTPIVVPQTVPVVVIDGVRYVPEK
jgi:hypothetical protein